MTEPDPDSGPQSPPQPAPAAPTKSPPPRKSRLRRRLGSVGIGLGVLLVAGVVGLSGAEYYTSQPNFCGSCHVMDPYYESWSRDVHGAKFGVKCITCHYAPGEQHTIRAKFRGLSQVASYFSGRYGAGRPRAHVSDDSCLRSGCHGDRAFLTKTLYIGEPRMEQRPSGDRIIDVQRSPTVRFVHAKHLDVAAVRERVLREMAAIQDRLERTLDAAGRQRIQKATSAVGPAHEREGELRRVSADLGLSEATRKDAFDLMALEHRRIRVDQLDGLSCSACHTFDSSMKAHLTADRQVCYTCHFANEDFNRNTGECLRCHEPPRREVSVHTASADPARSVVMDHEDIVRRGVDCASCHLDVVRGAARVSERECIHCHDQSRFLEELASRNTETVRRYHAVHVAEQRAHCFDCHRAVQHGLLDAGQTPIIAAGFLEPVLNDCQHCHPNHHAAQVSLLTGTGGAGIAHPVPSAMIGSRVNCRACHTQPGEGAKGDALVRATKQSCTACHSDEYMQMFDSWKHEIEGYVAEIESVLTRLDGAIAERSARGQPLPDGVDARLSVGRRNAQLVKSGGGLHNRAFALQLLDAARDQLQEAETLLAPP
jgi:nitrate/TMAO reductase-like tetraheme cytochrome c subunit